MFYFSTLYLVPQNNYRWSNYLVPFGRCIKTSKIPDCFSQSGICKRYNKYYIELNFEK